MVHLEQVMWPNPPNTVKLNGMTETEMWWFKERLYKGLVTVEQEPYQYSMEPGHDRWHTYYTIFEDNALGCFGVWTNGDPSVSWCYITEIEKRECGPET